MLPSPVTEGPDDNGIKRIISYRHTADGKVEKVIQTIKVITHYIKTPVAAIDDPRDQNTSSNPAPLAAMMNAAIPGRGRCTIPARASHSWTMKRSSRARTRVARGGWLSCSGGVGGEDEVMRRG